MVSARRKNPHRLAPRPRWRRRRRRQRRLASPRRVPAAGRAALGRRARRPSRSPRRASTCPSRSRRPGRSRPRQVEPLPHQLRDGGDRHRPLVAAAAAARDRPPPAPRAAGRSPCARGHARRPYRRSSLRRPRRAAVAAATRYGGRMASPFTEIEVDDRVVKVTNPDRVYFPESGATKLDLVEYYLAVGPGIVNALFERPVHAAPLPQGPGRRQGPPEAAARRRPRLGRDRRSCTSRAGTAPPTSSA